MTPTTVCPICNADARYESSGRDLMFDRHERHDYFGCSSCALVFMHPMPDMETIASYYPSSYMIYEDDDRVAGPGWWKRLVLKHRLAYRHLDTGLFSQLLAPLAVLGSETAAPAFVPNGRLLDVGCGNGRFLRAMRSLGWTVQGVEFSEDGVKVCRKSNLAVHHGDLASAAFPDGQFDVVTVRHVIEHVPDPMSFVGELARILKPGGQLILETPNSAALGRRWLSINWYANDVPRHLFLYAPGNLKRLGEHFGLACRALSLSTSPKSLLNSIDYILGNRGKPSKRMRSRRFFARLYVWLAQRSGQGDIIHACFTKP